MNKRGLMVKWQIRWMSVVIILTCSAAQAQPISYEQTLRQARVGQPLLEARELQVDAFRQTAEAADELPDPVLKGGIVNLPFTGPAAFDLDRQLPSQIQVGVEQAIPNLAKRRARADMATSDIRVSEARLGMASRDVVLAAGQAWISLNYAQQRQMVAQGALEDLGKLVPVARSAVAAGSARPAESLEVRRALLDIDDASTRIEADQEAAQARLARYIPGEGAVALGSAPSTQVDPVRLRANLGRNPEIVVANAAEGRATAAIELAQADKRPDFGVNASFGRRNPDFGNVVSVMGSITLPLFTGRRQEPRIAAAEAQAMAARAEREDALRAVTAQFEADLAMWRSAVRQWQRAREGLLPLARDRADLETASFAAGRADLIDVISARTALALLQLEILEREEAAVQAAAKLRLTYSEGMP